MPTYLLKTEPDCYSWSNLVADRKCTWDGVTNAAALGHLRKAQPGDEAFIYHTGDEKAIVGLAKVISQPYEDPANPGLNKDGAPRFAVVDLKPLRAAKEPVTLAQIKADERFARFPLVTIGRLGVMPVPPVLDRIIRKMAGL